ncbi:FtsW/RodA/SpoVE family cell cycle protein [Planktothrix sp. FACHB-1355]|uniref:Probable peptidoglycan glycosyltransferase FtsW n=1 Tax=Aerosakkonema funiforme FACHB-1375 TaxID=2949571 RepID=A0A926VGD4_9CYAN|nr:MULTISPECIES: FtsW/RodA/SpoVE family cell cycle protein [Oscillatoriales]MBD2182292.1 FtsW/RodA/SpoVE family cell cycle protein [Aerosakkonema funiforme FACHB-1375]MBD3560522.1 FtsW/RodA/SpoVE family cell cycle protein [Planktothrix sp. FACHB-1355]
MAVNLRHLIPFFDGDREEWGIQARLLRWLTFLWLFMGIVVLFSASYPVGDAYYGDGLYYVKRQLISILMGMVGFNLIVRFPLRYILGMAHWFVVLLLGLIIVTLIPGLGTTTNGATRWLALGPMPIQPSELIKPFLVLQSARIFGQWDRLRWKVRLTWLFIFSVVLLGILLQPNLSTTAFCGMTIWLIALAAGLPYIQLGGTAFAGLLLGIISITRNEYQQKRIMSFLNPWADPMKNGYQLVQSLLAVGSGGVWGSGYGLSQQKLFYLPIQYTDFIFAVFAEEFGFVGGMVLFLLLFGYGTMALIVAMKTQNVVHRLVAIGVMILLVGQSLMNIAVATGALPTTGLPLPLFSYGGNSMIASLLAAGLLIRVARESSEAEVVSLEEKRSAVKRGRRRNN